MPTRNPDLGNDDLLLIALTGDQTRISADLVDPPKDQDNLLTEGYRWRNEAFHTKGAPRAPKVVKPDGEWRGTFFTVLGFLRGALARKASFLQRFSIF